MSDEANDLFGRLRAGFGDALHGKGLAVPYRDKVWGYLDRAEREDRDLRSPIAVVRRSNGDVPGDDGQEDPEEHEECALPVRQSC